MFGFEPDEGDEDFDDEDQIQEDLTTLATRLEEVGRPLEMIGLYPDMTAGPPMPMPVETIRGPKMGFVVRCLVGDVAFTQAVQNPDQYGVENELAQIEHDLLQDRKLDERNKIQKAMDEGKSFFDDYEDED